MFFFCLNREKVYERSKIFIGSVKLTKHMLIFGGENCQQYFGGIYMYIRTKQGSWQNCISTHMGSLVKRIQSADRSAGYLLLAIQDWTINLMLVDIFIWNIDTIIHAGREEYKQLSPFVIAGTNEKFDDVFWTFPSIMRIFLYRSMHLVFLAINTVNLQLF